MIHHFICGWIWMNCTSPWSRSRRWILKLCQKWVVPLIKFSIMVSAALSLGGHEKDCVDIQGRKLTVQQNTTVKSLTWLLCAPAAREVPERRAITVLYVSPIRQNQSSITLLAYRCREFINPCLSTLVDLTDCRRHFTTFSLSPFVYIGRIVSFTGNSPRGWVEAGAPSKWFTSWCQPQIWRHTELPRASAGVVHSPSPCTQPFFYYRSSVSDVYWFLTQPKKSGLEAFFYTSCRKSTP